MSPAAYEQIARDEDFVRKNWIAFPNMVRRFVEDMRTGAIAKMDAARSHCELGIAVAFGRSALRAIAALDELEQGAGGTACAYQPELAARVAAAMGRPS